jgi:hypothetical protein
VGTIGTPTTAKSSIEADPKIRPGKG